MIRNRKYIVEGIDETGTPDMKYYAFDWDDNIMTMPTKIILKDVENSFVGILGLFLSIIGDFFYILIIH